MRRSKLLMTLALSSLIIGMGVPVANQMLSKPVSIQAKATNARNKKPVNKGQSRKSVKKNQGNPNDYSDPNKQYDVSATKKSGEMTLNKNVKAIDAKQANREVVLKKGSRVAYRKLGDGSILVGNNKYKSSDSPNSAHELLVEDAYKGMFNGKSNKGNNNDNKGQSPSNKGSNATKGNRNAKNNKKKKSNFQPNNASEHPHASARFSPSSKGATKGSLPKTSQSRWNTKLADAMTLPLFGVIAWLLVARKHDVNRNRK